MNGGYLALFVAQIYYCCVKGGNGLSCLNEHLRWYLT